MGCLNNLPTREVLHFWQIVSVWMCSLCYCGVESNIHVLWFCEGSRNTLVLLVSQFVYLSLIPFTPIMHLYFVRQFRQSLSCQDLRIFSLILSSIWRCLAIQQCLKVALQYSLKHPVAWVLSTEWFDRQPANQPSSLPFGQATYLDNPSSCVSFKANQDVVIGSSKVRLLVASYCSCF